ncbi:hypothetical protein HAALTHF_27660n [Vreelandella aquamarina]|nr:hypothetical protein HAALTHF_27660n [Halomonas axialensis]
MAGFIRLKPQRKWVWVAGAALQAVAALALALLALMGSGAIGGSLVLAALVMLSLARGSPPLLLRTCSAKPSPSAAEAL